MDQSTRDSRIITTNLSKTLNLQYRHCGTKKALTARGSKQSSIVVDNQTNQLSFKQIPIANIKHTLNNFLTMNKISGERALKNCLSTARTTSYNTSPKNACREGCESQKSSKPSFSIMTMGQIKDVLFSNSDKTNKAQIMKARISNVLKMKKQSEHWSHVDVPASTTTFSSNIPESYKSNCVQDFYTK